MMIIMYGIRGFTQEGILRSDERVEGNPQIVMCIVC